MMENGWVICVMVLESKNGQMEQDTRDNGNIIKHMEKENFFM
jgi:hypothetical protein